MNQQNHTGYQPEGIWVYIKLYLKGIQTLYIYIT